MRKRFNWALVVGLLLVGVAGCVERETRPVIEVDAITSLADQPLHIRVTGLEPGEDVNLTAQAKDHAGDLWEGHATFVADSDGVVDLDRDAPVDGTYEGVDGMGLFSSMTGSVPGSGESKDGFAPPFPEVSDRFEVTILGLTDHPQPAPVILTRVWLGPGVTHRRLDVATDKVTGELYEPSTAGGSGVLLLGGSEGGISNRYWAALLASHGYPTLALGYFALPGMPKDLHDISIEYFADAARLLPGPVRVVGSSRGTEAALLLSALYPGLVDGTVLFAPANRVWGGFPPPGNAWTYRGKPQTTIPFRAIDGRVLAFAGADDMLWPAVVAAESIKVRTGGESVVYPDAGHGVGGVPYLAPGATIVKHPVTGEVLNLGGTRQANEMARRDSWTRLLAFLTGQ